MPDPERSWPVRAMPILGQLTHYRLAWLRADVLAGLSVAAVAIPSAIALSLP
jgi:sulfate permease, SulP family